MIISSTESIKSGGVSSVTKKINKELAIVMRLEGKTCQEIADHFGVSNQAVSRMLRNQVRYRKDGKIFDQIPYKGLYEFMQSNHKITVPKLALIMGMTVTANNNRKVERLLQGKCTWLPKKAYDGLIKHSGMTYEQLFELREGFEEVQDD